MEELKNLTCEIKIQYINDAGTNIIISKRIDENGLEVKRVHLGDVCVTEETIGGRVLSGKYTDKTTSCGYRYDYKKNNSEYLTIDNENISLEETVRLINSTKMDVEFLHAQMVFASIVRKDFKVCILKKGTLNITKTVTAQNGQGEECGYRELVSLSKSAGEELFTAVSKEQSCKKEEAPDHLKVLIDIIEQNPNSYKELREIKRDALGITATI